MKDLFLSAEWIYPIISILITLITAYIAPKTLLRYYRKISNKSMPEQREKNTDTLEFKCNNKVCDDDFLELQKRNTIDELCEKRNFDKFLKRISFMLAVITSVIGTVILFICVILSFFMEKDTVWITVTSGAIVECVSFIYFWLVNKTTKEVNDNCKQLEKNEDLNLAINLVRKIKSDSIRDDVYTSIIYKLANSENKSTKK